MSDGERSFEHKESVLAATTTTLAADTSSDEGDPSNLKGEELPRQGLADLLLADLGFSNLIMFASSHYRWDLMSYINDDLGVLGEYGGRDVKKLKMCEEKEADDIVPIYQRMTLDEMFEAGLIAEKGSMTSDELLKLGMTEDDFYGDGKRNMTEDEVNLYLNAVRESGGYDVPDFPDVDHDGLIQPIHNLGSYIEDLTTSIDLAIKENDPDLKLVKILKANDQGWHFYYITFEAQGPNGEIKTYQIKSCVGFPWEKTKVEEFRLKPSI